MIDSVAYQYLYGYAPSMIYAQGQYHVYYCSSGTNVLDWDHVRYATSPDLMHWSRPVDLLTATPVERATCDPSVIRHDAGDGPYYYMFYTGNMVAVQSWPAAKNAMYDMPSTDGSNAPRP